MPEETNSEKRKTGEPFYLIVSRLVPHKNLDMVVDAFNKLGHRLVIAGAGPLAGHLAHRANRNIVFTGWLADDRIAALYRACQAVIIPNDEDFGLTAVEAMTHGKPVLALRYGGATETVVAGITGEFFDDAIPEALADGIKRLRGSLDQYDAAAIRTHTTQWSPEHFASRMRAVVETV